MERRDRKLKPVGERFWGRVDKSGGPESCWPWLASFFKSGHGSGPYGRFEPAGGRSVLAHRFAYEIAKGAIAEGMKIRHTCDNPSCCNPSHLIPGTQKQNIDDRQERGRTARGERGGKAKLTEADVLEIRADTTSTYRQIRAKYGISDGTIGSIKTRRTWRHV